jgi:acetyl-CoA synthetase
VEALPEAPDASFIAVNADATVAQVKALAERGAGGLVCYASGFAEVGGAGIQKQQALMEAAAGLPLLGPNCYGMLNYLDGTLEPHHAAPCIALGLPHHAGQSGRL